jgi:hypothetical protein
MAETLSHLDDAYGGIESYLSGPGEMTGTALQHLSARLIA